MSLLDWVRIHPEAFGSHSKCRRYSVNRAADERTWEVWKLAPGGPWFARLGHGFESEEAARARAQEDAQ